MTTRTKIMLGAGGLVALVLVVRSLRNNGSSASSGILTAPAPAGRTGNARDHRRAAATAGWRN